MQERNLISKAIGIAAMTIVVITGVTILTVLAILRSWNPPSGPASPPNESEAPAAEAPLPRGSNRDGPPAHTPIGVAAIDAAVDNIENAEQRARRLLPLAKDGNTEAQYLLAKTLGECQARWRAYFVRGDYVRTLDEALVWGSTRPGLRAEGIRATYDHCATLMEDPTPLGTADAWLKQAAAAGEPRALALAATEILQQLMIEEIRTGQPTPAALKQEAQAQLREAIASAEPEALWIASDFLAGPDTLALRLVACARGFDCGFEAGWYADVCALDPHCLPGETGVDFLHRQMGPNQTPIIARAMEMEALLDAGRGGELLP